MSDDNSTGSEEARLAALLRRVDAEAPSVDAEQLRAIRERALDALAEKPRVVNETTKPRSNRSLIYRSGAALLATAAAVLLAWNFWPASSIGAPTFAKVLANLRQAETLELRVIKPEQSAEVWVRAPGLVRWQETRERYRISAGSRLWKIDEAANTVTTGDSPWFVNPQEQVDLLALLELGVSDAAPLLKSRPSDQREYAGRMCHVYRAEAPSAEKNLVIEAFADVATGQLAGILARRPEDKPNAPPLAELQLVAINPKVDESRFVVAKSLTEDGRIGAVADAQGIVVLRPMLAQRWTPICRETLLKAGDWLRTDRRGANAVRVRLSSDAELTLGPGTLVECVSPTQARLHTGEAQVALAANVTQAFELLAPRTGAQQVAAGAKQMWRVATNGKAGVKSDEKLVEVKEPPRWLGGFEGTTTNESLGSLIVHLPDGRNEPLSVGYHKVNVEIRDQIARTTIEESFVNHTDARLEGVFQFPLPQDASISGFGMWIGNELVEADVVEKQRAREIFETILRENRDPGLLEWTSGNLFKARVFPIEAHSEKRVKIVYTQVLPLRANRYRYTYGLRSDLLRTRPVRELELTVTVNSARELRSVTCPTHSTRNELTPHAARVEFAAQDYTPDRDFEVVCDVDGQGADVIAIPHARGNDGYILLQISPPAREGKLQRETLPDGRPLNLVFLCDTSASMDVEKRRQQSEFVATVLASLGERDQFLLCAADVAPNWLSDQPQPATPERTAKAQAFLDERISLGWTDLDKAFAGVLEKAPTGAQVIYIGDGMVTTGDGDPVAFVRRLQELTARANPPGQPRTRWLNAVTVGNAGESIVLGGIATAGGGSVRAISGERTPQAVALELLGEITEPGLRELKVEFRGVQVAAVYPDRLPNVAAGTQQVLVARYLPTGKNEPGERQQGEVIVSGLLGNEPVRYTAKLDFSDAEAGNSFIPRLWARGHLDHLLRQGNSPAIRDEIIALSEEFHIITPYTSLLVLESDADRERFGVKRRYEMRDGERFFADGQADATFSLRQKQSKHAGDWRLGLRRQALAELVGLGRGNPQQARPSRKDRLTRLDSTGLSRWGDGDGDFTNEWQTSGGGGYIRPFTNHLSLVIDEGIELGAFSVPSDEQDTPFAIDDATRFSGVDAYETQTGRLMLGVGVNSSSGLVGNAVIEELDGRYVHSQGQAGEEYDAADFQNMALAMQQNPFGSSDKLKTYGINQEGQNQWFAEPPYPGPSGEGFGGMGGGIGGSYPYHTTRGPRDWMVTNGLSAPGVFSADLDVPFFGENVDLYDQEDLRYIQGANRGFRWKGGFERPPHPTAWLQAILPALASPAGRLQPQKDPRRWSAEAIALAKTLLRTESLRAMTGGIELRRSDEYIDPVWNVRSTNAGDVALVSPTAWLTQSLDPREECLVNFCDVNERGVYSRTTSLGRARMAFQRDLNSPPLSINDDSLAALASIYSEWTARVEPGEANQARLILAYKHSDQEIRLLIDTLRHVVLRRETFVEGRSQGATTHSDFVEVAGSWWARRQTVTDDRARVIVETTLDVKALAPEQFATRMKEELTGRDQAWLLRAPAVKLDVARQKNADGSANFDDYLRLLLEACRVQQWDEALAQLDAVEKLAADRPGSRWMRTSLLQAMRRNEDAKQRLLSDARALVGTPAVDDLPRATLILRLAQSVTSASERLELIELLKPVFDRQPAEWKAVSQWRRTALEAYQALGRDKDSTALMLALAKDDPADTSAQVNYANQFAQNGDFDAAYAWLQAQLDRPIERDASSDSQLRTAYAVLYKRQGRWADWLRFSEDWIKRRPIENTPYAEHLTALIYNDRVDEADKTAERWLAEARAEERLKPADRARLAAAIAHAEQNGRGQSYEQAERWSVPLSETAKYLLNAKSPQDVRVTQDIVRNAFAQTEACARLRGYALERLQAEAGTLSPAQLTLLISWASYGEITLSAPLAGRTHYSGHEVPGEVWRAIVTKLHERWRQATDADERRELGATVRSIYGSRFGDDVLPFYLEQLAAASDDEKPQYLNDLYQALAGRAWTQANEDEAFELLARLNAQLAPVDREAADASALMLLVDRMLAGRQVVSEQALQDQGRINELTGQELQAKRTEALRTNRAALAARLHDLAAKGQSPLTPWLRIEWTYLQIHLNDNSPEVAEICWQLLGETPRANGPDLQDLAAKLEPRAVEGKAAEEPDWEPLRVAIVSRRLEGQLRGRALTTVMNLAARRTAAPASVARVTDYLDAGIAQGGAEAQAWKNAKFRWLIALDQPDQLERELRGWIQADTSLSRWRKPLALLLAERGRLDEAVSLFEAAEKDKLLVAADYATLANWYLAQNERAKHDQAREDAIARQPERIIAQRLNGARNMWSSRTLGLPTVVDDDTLTVCRVLFKKSAHPENYLYELGQLYDASKDSRLLEALPSALLGRSSQQVYGVLENMRSQVLQNILNEATSDEIVAHIARLREQKLSVVDLRALDLLEALVEGRASDLVNQPGPHSRAALAALRRAFDREWSAGEPLRMVAFLYHCGELNDAELAAEQLRQIRALRSQTAEGTSEHLEMTARLAMLQFHSYQQYQPALVEFEAAIRAFLHAQKEVWRNEDFQWIEAYVHMLADRGQFSAAETMLQVRLAQAANQQQRSRLEGSLWDLYDKCLDRDGAVSLGSGETLFANLLSAAQKDLAAANDEYARQRVVSRLVATLRIAKNKKLAGADAEIRKFAFDAGPAVLARQQEQYVSTLQQMMSVIEELNNDLLALEFVVARMEQFPLRVELTGQNAWGTLGSQLNSHRFRARENRTLTPEIDARALRLAIAELKQILQTENHNNSATQFARSGNVWGDKTPELTQVAIDVYEERKSSLALVLSVSHFLHHDLDAPAKAIELLFLADRDNVLDSTGRGRLVDYLQKAERFAESIPLLERLIERDPDTILYRAQLMTAYHRAERPQQMQELLVATEKHFHAGGRWIEHNVNVLAAACDSCDLVEQAAGYWDEAISQHRRNHPRGAGQDDALSDLYEKLALARSRQGQTRAAVDAALGSIISANSSQARQAYAQQTLETVLTKAKDVDTFLAQWDEEVAKSGQDSPRLRRSLGLHYQTLGLNSQAVRQFQIAVQLQPEDKRNHENLIACFDATEQPQAAIKELFALGSIDRYDATIYERLLERMKDNATEAERAATSIVEVAPAEAETHVKLAKIRENQQRWDEAIGQWRQVARLRALEPTGLIGLAGAQISGGETDDAKETIKKLRATTWPAHFGNVSGQATELEQRLPH